MMYPVIAVDISGVSTTYWLFIAAWALWGVVLFIYTINHRKAGELEEGSEDVHKAKLTGELSTVHFDR